jgi:hypothetical protein
MINIKNNLLSLEERSELYNWVINNDHLYTFKTDSEQSDDDRFAFAVTYSIMDLPDVFNIFVDVKTNVYNIISIVTHATGDIPTHIDDDLTCYMRSKNMPNIYIKHPHTTCVYYVNIWKDMIGGETVFEDCMIKPESNMFMSFPSDAEHSVTAMHSGKSPRVVIVCEKYKLLTSAVKHLNTPIWRAG